MAVGFAIADLICDLGHLAEERGFDFLSEVKRGIGHWYAERHSSDRDYLGPDAVQGVPSSGRLLLSVIRDPALPCGRRDTRSN